MGFVVKNTIIEWLADLVCPYSCVVCGRVGRVLCECCKKEVMDENVWDGSLGEEFEWVLALGRRGSRLFDLVIKYKYDGMRGLGRCLGEMLAEGVAKKQERNDKQNEWGERVVVVPLPTAKKHIKSRGFCHTRRMAMGLAECLGVKMEEILVRRNNTVQVGAGAKEREVQAKEAYGLNKKMKIKKKNYMCWWMMYGQRERA